MSSYYFTGVDNKHVTLQNETILQQEVRTPLNLLKLSAKEYEIELKVVSSFRSLDQQMNIWNQKALGQRDLLDLDSNLLDYSQLSPHEILYSILRWSAIPGMSRHHWGTDFDVVDNKTLEENPNYKIQLTPREFQKNGIFANLGQFLDGEGLTDTGFFRPYKEDLGGVAPEPWHLSFASLALEQETILTFKFFQNWINSPSLKKLVLIELLKENAKEIYERFVINTQINPMA